MLRRALAQGYSGQLDAGETGDLQQRRQVGHGVVVQDQGRQLAQPCQTVNVGDLVRPQIEELEVHQLTESRDIPYRVLPEVQHPQVAERLDPPQLHNAPIPGHQLRQRLQNLGRERSVGSAQRLPDRHLQAAVRERSNRLVSSRVFADGACRGLLASLLGAPDASQTYRRNHGPTAPHGTDPFPVGGHLKLALIRPHESIRTTVVAPLQSPR